MIEAFSHYIINTLFLSLAWDDGFMVCVSACYHLALGGEEFTTMTSQPAVSREAVLPAGDGAGRPVGHRGDRRVRG